MGIVTAMFLIGAALGGIVFGWLGDRIGRVKAMTAAVLVYSLFSALGAFAHQPGQLAVPRLLASFGMGGEWALGVALVMEAWPASSRPLMASLIGAAAHLGFLLIAAIGLGLASFVAVMVIGCGLHGILPGTWADALFAHDGWRLLMLLGAAPAAGTVLMVMFVPESETWKHATANTPVNRITDIFAHEVSNRAVQAALLASIALIGTWCSVQQIPPWANKMAAAQGLNPLVTSSYAQIASGLRAGIGSILGALAAQWLNRRQAYFIMALLSLVGTAVFFRTPQEFGAMFLVLVFMVGGVTAAFFGWLPLSLPELFPTWIRATATGFAFNSGRFVAAVAALISGQLLAAFGEDYQQMCSGIGLVHVFGLYAI